MNQDDLFVFSQHIAPQHLISKGAGKLAECRVDAIKNKFISWFIKQYDVDMSEAAIEDPSAYEHFNDFFTRALKPGARTIDQADNSIVSPVDGAISQIGNIRNGRVFQAKGQSFDVCELLGGNQALANEFSGGKFSTIYLSPKDYHRIHMPLAGTLREMNYIPGKLFSVNPVTTSKVPRLFARNERVAAIFDTPAGPVAMVLVGAMIVASIETTWGGLAGPRSGALKRPAVLNYSYQDQDEAISLAKGDEMGRFKLGSTVVMLYPKDSVEFEADLSAESVVRMGQRFGSFTSS